MKNSINKENLKENYYTRVEKNEYHQDVYVVEVKILYKNKNVIRVFGYSNGSNYLRIDVETNSKVIKKLNLPYRKSKVVGSNKKYDISKLYNSKQLELGVEYNFKVLRHILKTYEEVFNLKFSKLYSSRITGITSKNEKSRRVYVSLDRLYSK